MVRKCQGDFRAGKGVYQVNQIIALSYMYQILGIVVVLCIFMNST